MHPAASGPFKIERELGRGGMGEVYLARDTRLDRQVAIKALPAHLAQDPDRLARFQREAKVLASLNHPGIGAIYGLEEAEASGHHGCRIPGFTSDPRDPERPRTFDVLNPSPLRWDCTYVPRRRDLGQGTRRSRRVRCRS